MPRVLVLEDDDDLRTILEILLRGTGHEVSAFRSYTAMLSAARDALSADVALLDVNLGEGVPSGIDAYRWLRANAFRGRVRFLTGHAKGHPLVEEACRVTDAGVLEKPVTAEELARVVSGEA